MTTYHVVGIGGAGMSAIARLLLARGTVSGSDNGRWPLSEALVPLGATVHDTFDPAHVAGADVVIRSSAYGDVNVEVRAARERGIPVWKRDEAWRLLATGQRVVAVAGTHGKTTTTGMVWTALRAGRIDASLLCGGELRDLGANAHVGSDAVLVVEADEYDRAFLALAPDVAVVTNVDHDHVDVYPTREDYFEAFREFARRVIPGGTLLGCVDDPGAAALLGWARTAIAGRRVLGYGTSPKADLRLETRATKARGTVVAESRWLSLPGGRGLPLTLIVPGLHNMRNAAGALGAAAALGVPVYATSPLANFVGAARRLEELGTAGGVTVVDDYAHHPAELAASLEAMRPRAAGRLVALFQPHTPSRLSAFFAGFATALREADVALVAETFASAREQADPEGARALAAAVPAAYARDSEEAAQLLAERVRPGDLVLVLGAGDIRRAGERLLALLRERAPEGGAPRGAGGATSDRFAASPSGDEGTR